MSDQGSQGLLSPLLRSARLNAAKPWLHGKILDIGCGSGALATLVTPEFYAGFDRDSPSLTVARNNYPEYRFLNHIPEGETFDTVVALAVLEHLPDPRADLTRWTRLLGPSGRIVLTTPHKAYRVVHDLGAKLGAFSQDAADEHEQMFERGSLTDLANSSGLVVHHYERFLIGANQLLVLKMAP